MERAKAFSIEFAPFSQQPNELITDQQDRDDKIENPDGKMYIENEMLLEFQVIIKRTQQSQEHICVDP